MRIPSMMRPRFVAMLGIVFGLAGVASLSCDKNEDEGVEGLSLINSGSTVEVDDTWKACEAVTDCVRVGTSCDGCCAEEAVASARQTEFESARGDLCAGYSGGQCDCAPLATDVACVDNTCALVESEGGW